MFRTVCTPLLAGLLLAGCGDASHQAWSGYVEADYVRVAAPLSGRLTVLNADRGMVVKPGQPLFALDATPERAAVAEAQAHVARSEASASDLDKGRRPDEMAVIARQLDGARTALGLSEAELKRQQALARQGFISHSALDTIRAQVTRDTAQVGELEAQLRVARLAGREDMRRAAQADVAAAKAAQQQSVWQLSQKAVTAPVNARVEDTLYRVGEWVTAGSPVLSLLPPDAVKARFFVPETEVARLRYGTPVTLTCDGCGHTIPATISFIATQAEFTPPVIYSKENRGKLVFLVEARPSTADATRLRPGLPLDVSLTGGGK